MINRIDIENAIYDWLAAESGIAFYLADQNMGAPSGQFGSFQVTVINTVGQDEKIYHYNPNPTAGLDSMDEIIDGLRTLMVSINVFRGDSFGVMNKIAASLEKSYTNDALWLNGLNFVTRSEIRNLSDIISAQYEQRHQMDATFYVGSRYESPVDLIETVEYTKDYYG